MKERNKYHIADICNLIIFYSVFICLFVASIMGIVQCAEGTLQLHNAIFRVLFVLLMCLPYLIKMLFKITFSRVVSIVFYLYMFLAAFLGNVLQFYVRLPEWDMFIHFLMGATLSVLSIYILNYTIYKKDKSRHNLFFTFLFMLMFAMGIGALWELYEFTGDLLFNIGAQRYLDVATGTPFVGQVALYDTMLDLFMDFLGALAGIVFTLLLIKINKRFLKTFVITKLKTKQEIEDIEE